MNNLAGGAWRGLEECWGLGVNFYQKTFMKMINFQSLVCCGLAGLSDVPVFSRVEREEMSSMKVKVFVILKFSCLGFIIFVSVLETG